MAQERLSSCVAIFLSLMDFGEKQTTSRATLSIRCRLFARYAEALGVESVDLELRAPATVADAVAALRASKTQGDLIPERPLVAMKQEHVALDRKLADGDELVFLPPLAGG